MMNSELETQCAQEIRELARQYCDGAFNKGEYRRRRRDVLLRCVSEDFAPLPDEQDDVPMPSAVVALPVASTVSRVALAVATLLVLGIMGFLIYSIS